MSYPNSQKLNISSYHACECYMERREAFADVIKITTIDIKIGDYPWLFRWDQRSMKGDKRKAEEKKK